MCILWTLLSSWMIRQSLHVDKLVIVNEFTTSLQPWNWLRCWTFSFFISKYFIAWLFSSSPLKAVGQFEPNLAGKVLSKESKWGSNIKISHIWKVYRNFVFHPIWMLFLSLNWFLWELLEVCQQISSI